ncbi:trpF [Symbiodinium sp. KB8]|nr:trpF [Symbiodinium sp. KB8]
MGADAVGFIFAPSQRQVAPQVVYDITRRLPPEVLTVGVFKDEHPSRVVEIANKSGVKAVQLHGRETIEQTREIAHNVRYVIKAFGADSPHLAKADQYGTDLVMVDSPGGGTGKLFDWNVVSDVPDSVRLILAGGLDPDNVASAIQAVEPWGVDVASGVELSPGKKDPSKVRRFIANARAAAPTPYLGPDDLPYDWADE